MLASRKSGILLHPTSLPGKFNIGDLGPEAYHFVDWLETAGQSLWQILPLGPTGAGDSPYQPFSSFAGNEILISLELLANAGYIDLRNLANLQSCPSRNSDYGSAFHEKLPFLKDVAAEFLTKAEPSALSDFDSFCLSEKSWLDDYAIFMTIKRHYEDIAKTENVEGAMWGNFWPRPLAHREKSSMDAFTKTHAKEIEVYRVLQFFFYSQWRSLKSYANERGISIIGDIPMFVSYDSVDVWAHPELFQVDANLQPICVAGVPPDYFSEDGQFWGNPLYSWERHETTNFSWWIARIKSALSLCDYVRIDHFRAFESYWAVPAHETTARNGSWIKAPGRKLFERLRIALGDSLPIIAEDLGFITEEVRDLRDNFGLPGMKILQFAFDTLEAGSENPAKNEFLPHNYSRNSVVYTGSHDNDTLNGWLAKASSQEITVIDSYLGYRPEDHRKALIREGFKSVASFALLPMQDVLGLGSECRMNIPSTPSGNWRFRLFDSELSETAADELRKLSALYGRNYKTKS